MKLVDFAIRNPVSVAVWVLFIALFAVVSILRLPIQLAPDVEKPEITVETNWFGASPQEVEREIIDEQEEELRGVEGLEKMFSESSDGRGRIILRFPAGMDMDTALVRVANRLNQVEEYPTRTIPTSRTYTGAPSICAITTSSTAFGSGYSPTVRTT